MSRLISELLGTDEPLFSIDIARLENASGNQSSDVRLSVEIMGRARSRIQALGLDPVDSSGREIYHALIDLIKLHDEFLVRHLGGHDLSDVSDLLPRIHKVAQRINISRNVWVIKHSVAKRLLKQHPPKKLMTLLKYRSIDSMLKRESVGELFGAVRLVESQLWLDKLIDSYRLLQPTDFEIRPIEVLLLDDKKWGIAAKEYLQLRRHNIVHSKEVGSILLLPLPVKRMPGITIVLLPLLLHYVNELRLYSSYLKLHQVEPNFGELVVDVIKNDISARPSMCGQSIHWRTIQQYYSDQDSKSHPELFEPYLLAEDMTWQKAEEVLYRLEPALYFWHGMDFVGLFRDGKPVSFNMMDVAVDYVNRLPYERRTSHHLKRSLWNELQVRYLRHQPLESQVLRQLDNYLFSGVAINREVYA